MMGVYIGYWLVLWAVVILVIAGMLFVGRWGFKIDVTPRRIWRGAFYLSLLSLLGAGAGYLVTVWYIRATFGGGDPGLGGMIQCAIGALIGGLITLGLLAYGFFSVAKGKPIARARRFQASLVVVIFVPLILVGLFWAVKSFERPVRGAVNRARIEAHTVSDERTHELIEEYGLPPVPGASYPRFSFNEHGQEYYHAVFHANASAPVRDVVPWREFTEMIVRDVKAGLVKAGYEVEEKQGEPKRLWTDQGEENLPDVHLIGRKDGRFVCYRIPYAFTQGCAFPRITMDFGDEEYYDPNKLYFALNE